MQRKNKPLRRSILLQSRTERICLAGCRSSLRKVNVVPANVEPISCAPGRWQHLQRRGTPQVGIPARVDGKQIVAADVHDDEGICGEETAPISPRFKSMALNVDGRF